MGHVALTTPLLGCFVTLMLKLDMAYMYAKCDNSNFSRSRNMIGAPKKFKMGHVTTTTPYG